MLNICAKKLNYFDIIGEIFDNDKLELESIMYREFKDLSTLLKYKTKENYSDSIHDITIHAIQTSQLHYLYAFIMKLKKGI